MKKKAAKKSGTKGGRKKGVKDLTAKKAGSVKGGMGTVLQVSWKDKI